MLSDALIEGLPKLIARTLPYVREKQKFDYGETAVACKKHVSGLILVALELDNVLFAEAGQPDARLPALRTAFEGGNYDAVIDAFLPKCHREVKEFQKLFKNQMQVREILNKQGVTWINPEVCSQPEIAAKQ